MPNFAWTVPQRHPAFAGHFPGRPILPGVVLLDRALQLAATAFAIDAARLRVASAKFLSPVPPGETLDIALRRREGSDSIQFEIRGADLRVVASGSFGPRPEVAA